MSTERKVELRLSGLFELVGQPTRLKIMLVIGENEACVCHIEAVMGIRQATISQHLMVLRDAGLVAANRDGRNIFYRLTNLDLLATIYQFASIAGLSTNELRQIGSKPAPNCPCPRCNPGIDSELTCKKIKK